MRSPEVRRRTHYGSGAGCRTNPGRTPWFGTRGNAVGGETASGEGEKGSG